MTYRGPMARAVGKALASVEIDERDEGAAALCRRYAALIDAAQPSAIYGRHLREVRAALDVLEATGADMGDYDKAFTKIAEALAAHSVASDLGPKLLAALTSLGLTLSGRGVKGGAGNVTAPVERRSHLDELRARRAKRAGAGGPATVDPATS